MPAARCRHCGYGPDAHYLRSHYETPGASPKDGFSCALTDCRGFQDINAQLYAELEAQRRAALR